ncbi:MAG: Cu(I)-responsive transcriptional regulator [Gammaproteobacteria bacterium]|nr:MAG: Cu(I)-responsive transcriptional regulator [Gammaproteobacteria bacterium]
MNIGTVADASGVPAKTIRYYESVGLIPPARRAQNGYRRYSDTDVQTLLFVQRARSLGFSVEDVASLLGLWRDKRRASAEVKELAARHVVRIEEKVRELESIRHVIQDLMERCHGDDRPQCPILDELGNATAVSGFGTENQPGEG